MTKARSDGLYLVFLGAAVFLLVGFALGNAVPISSPDFRVVYYAARCAIEHHDPYQPNELALIYHNEGGETPRDTEVTRKTETRYIYPPTAFVVTAPFALMPFGPARLLWLGLTAASYLLACFLVWDLGAPYAPTLSGALVALTLANSELFLVLGNPAGIALSFCIIAVWCFIKDRLIFVGVACFGLSLILKPHDVAFVWLYFAVCGGVVRRRAMQTLAIVAVLSVAVELWIAPLSPNWIAELHQNLVACAAHGDISDPGPASSAAHGIGMMISLQPMLSLIKDDPSFYDPLAYLISCVLLLPWFYKTLKTRYSPETAWFALAPIAAISELPIYHRIYDTRILLLAIPFCAILSAKRSLWARPVVTITALTILFTGGLPWGIFLHLLKNLHLPDSDLFRTLIVVLQVAPVPLLLLTSSLIYLTVDWNRTVTE